MIDYQDFEFHFEEEDSALQSSGSIEVFDIRLQVGNRPIVKNLYHLFRLDKKEISSDMKVLYKDKDLYSVLHAVSAVSQGAKIKELVYEAKMVDDEAQTIDLLPATKFIEYLGGKTKGTVSLSATGNISASTANIENVDKSELVDLGGGIKLNTNIEGGISGEFSFSFKFPVVQSMGIASDSCTWILNPQSDKPLNGDQLLMQVIAVPKKTKKIKYEIEAEIKASEGWLWKKKAQKTTKIKVEIDL